MRTLGVVATSLAGAAVGLLGLAPLAAAGLGAASEGSGDWAEVRQEAIDRLAEELGVTPDVLEAAGREVIATDLEEAAAKVRAGTEERVAPEQWLDPRWRSQWKQQRGAEFARDLAAELDLEQARVEQAIAKVRSEGFESWGERLGRLLRERLGG